MKQIALLIASLMLMRLFIPLSICTYIVMLFIKDSRERYKKVNKYSYAIAYVVDLMGNVLCSTLFNIILIKHGGYCFGFPGETISSVLGKNLKLGHLTATGKLLVRFLDFFERITAYYLSKILEMMCMGHNKFVL